MNHRAPNRSNKKNDPLFVTHSAECSVLTLERAERGATPRTSVLSQYVNGLLGFDAHRLTSRIVFNSSRALHHCGAERIHEARTCQRSRAHFATHEVDRGRLRKTHETQTRVLLIWASYSTCARTALKSDGDVALSEMEAFCRNCLGLSATAKAATEERTWTRSLSTNDQPPEVRFNNLLAPTSVMGQRRTKRVCHRTIWTPLVNPLRRTQSGGNHFMHLWDFTPM